MVEDRIIKTTRIKDIREEVFTFSLLLYSSRVLKK